MFNCAPAFAGVHNFYNMADVSDINVSLQTANQAIANAVNAVAPMVEGKRSYKYTQKLAQQQHERNIEMFNLTTQANNARQNFLLQNAKQMQVSDLRNAGISTASMTSPQTVATPPSGQSNGGSSSPFPTSFTQAAGQLLQGSLLASQIDQLRANAKLTDAQAEGQIIDNTRKNELIDSTINLNLSTEQLNNARTILSSSQRDLTESQKDLADLEAYRVRHTLDDYLKQMSLSTDKLQAEVDTLNLDNKIKLETLPYQIQLYVAQCFATNASGQASLASAELSRASAKSVLENVFLLEQRNNAFRGMNEFERSAWMRSTMVELLNEPLYKNAFLRNMIQQNTFDENYYETLNGAMKNPLSREATYATRFVMELVGKALGGSSISAAASLLK